MEMNGNPVLVDTSAYSGFNRGDQRLRPWFTNRQTLLVPTIVLGELRAGFAVGSKRKENERLLERFLLSPSVKVAPLTVATASRFADLFALLKKGGVALSTNDLWIAALAAEHAAPVLTLDTDFQRIPGIRVVSLEDPDL